MDARLRLAGKTRYEPLRPTGLRSLQGSRSCSALGKQSCPGSPERTQPHRRTALIGHKLLVSETIAGLTVPLNLCILGLVQTPPVLQVVPVELCHLTGV